MISYLRNQRVRNTIISTKYGGGRNEEGPNLGILTHSKGLAESSRIMPVSVFAEGGTAPTVNEKKTSNFRLGGN
jgi:hypothetical protein